MPDQAETANTPGGIYRGSACGVFSAHPTPGGSFCCMNKALSYLLIADSEYDEISAAKLMGYSEQEFSELVNSISAGSPSTRLIPAAGTMFEFRSTGDGLFICSQTDCLPTPPDSAEWQFDFASHSVIQSEETMRALGGKKVIPDVPLSFIQSGKLHPDDAEAYLDMYERLYSGEPDVDGVFRFFHPASGYRYIHAHYTTLFDESGTPFMALGASVDITERYLHESAYQRELAYRERMLSSASAWATLDVSSGTVMEEHGFGGDEHASSFCDFFQRAADSVYEDEDIRRYFSTLTTDSLISRHEKRSPALTFEYLLHSKSPLRVKYECRLTSDPATNDIIAFIYLIPCDSTEHGRMRLYPHADTDPLTGFLTAQAARERIQSYLSTAGSTCSHALFAADLDNFSRINKSFGRSSGDELITRAAEAVRSQFRSGDIFARTGDGFLVLMKDLPNTASARRKGDALVEALQFVCAGTGSTLELSASVGVSIVHSGSRTFLELLSAAERSLMCAKRAGKSTCIMEEEPESTDIPSSGEKSISAIQLRTLMDNIDAGVIIARVDGDTINFTYASPSYYKMNGRPAEERGIQGESILRYVHPDDIGELRETIIHAAVERQPFEVTYRVAESGGSTGWRHLRAVPLPDGKNTLLAVVTNITDLKLSTLQLEQRYNRTIAVRNQIDRDALGSFRLNLTKNTCGDGNTADESVRALQESGTADGFIIAASDLCCDDSSRESFRNVFHPRALISSFFEGQTSVSFDYRINLHGSRSNWIRTTALMAENPDSGDIEAIIYSRNIDSEMTSRAIVDRLMLLEYEFLALIDVESDVISVLNRTTEGVLRPPSDHALYADTLKYELPDFVTENELEECRTALSLDVIRAQLDRNGYYTCSFSVVGENGGTARKKWQYTYLDDSASVIVFTRSDITDLYSAQTDPVTGIFNRERFYAAARELIDDNPGTRFAIVRFDIDHFKAFNDLFGMAEGNRMLREVGSAFRRLKISQFLYGHVEADHFICCLPVNNLAELPTLKLCEVWLHEKHPEFDFTVRMGVYCAEDPSLEISLMSDRALLALRSIKGKYDERFAFYNDSMRAAMLEEQELVSDMRAALDNREFAVYLQPQYDFVNNRITGAEALVRWIHPRKGLISPGKFIPLFEENGFITRLDRYVWDRVCRFLREWTDAGINPVPISVNISRMDLYNKQLCDTLTSLVKKYDLPPSMLRLEITESAYMSDPDQLVNVVNQLRNSGFFVEMDDFGSGYSSLNTLKDVPVDLLKLDIGFLSSSNMDDGRGGIILNSVIRLARWLDLPVIVEGVETVRQVDYLRSIGCSLAQGYYFARPMPAADFEVLLSSSSTGNQSSGASTAEFFNSGEFWDPQSQATVIFNSFVGAAGLFEYHNGAIEVLRLNDKYYEATGVGRAKLNSFSGRMLDLVHPDDHGRVTDAINQARLGEGEVECESRWSLEDTPERVIWLRIRMRCIAKSSDRFVLYAAIENITEKKLMLEREARQTAELHAALNARRAEDERNRLLIQNTSTVVFDYDPVNDSIEFQRCGPDGIGRQTEENFLELLSSGNIVHPDSMAPIRSVLHTSSSHQSRGRLEILARLPGDSSYRWNSMDYVSLADETGRIYRVVGALSDIQHEKDREALIGRLSGQLKATVSPGGTTVAEQVFSLLYNADNIGDAIHSVLRTLGEHYNTSRVYIFEDSDDHSYCSNTFEWCAEGIKPFSSDFKHLDYPGGDRSYLDYYGDSGVLICADTSLTGEPERSVMAQHGIRSTVQCAIIESGMFFGYIGFADCNGPRVWTADEISTLSQVSRYVSMFLMRVRRQEEASFIDSMRLSLDEYSDYIYMVDPETYRVKYCNRATREHTGRSLAGTLCYREFCLRDTPCEGCPVTAIKEGRKPEPLEVRRPSDGLWMLTKASGVHFARRRMALVICTDITKYKEQ